MVIDEMAIDALAEASQGVDLNPRERRYSLRRAWTDRTSGSWRLQLVKPARGDMVYRPEFLITRCSDSGLWILSVNRFSHSKLSILRPDVAETRVRLERLWEGQLIERSLNCCFQRRRDGIRALEARLPDPILAEQLNARVEDRSSLRMWFDQCETAPISIKGSASQS